MKLFRSQNRSWWIFWVMTVATMFSYFHQVSLVAVSDAVEASLNVGPAGIATLAATFSIAYGCMQIPAGILSDTVGSRLSVTVALLVASAGTLLFAYASNLYTGMLARLLIGAGIAVVAVPLMKLTASWFPQSMFSRLTSLSFVVGGLGLLLATTPMVLLCTLVGWRSVYFFVAALTAVYAVLVWAVVRDRDNLSQSHKGFRRHFSRLRRAAPHLLSSRQLWFVGLWFFVQGGAFYAFTGLWSGQLLTKVLGVSAETMSLVLTLPVCALMSAPLLAWLADICCSKRAVLKGLSVASFVLAVPLTRGLPLMHPALLTAYFLAYAVATIGGTALVYAVAKDLFPTRYTGIVTGFINVFPFVGCSVIHQAIGFVINWQASAGQELAAAYATGFTVLLVAAAFGVAFSMALDSAFHT